MKKGYTYILVALLMLLALAGCVNKEEDYEPNFSIFFNAVVGNRTKANYTGVVFARGLLDDSVTGQSSANVPTYIGQKVLFFVWNSRMSGIGLAAN